MFRVFPGLLPRSYSVVSQVFRAMRAVQGRSHVLGDDSSRCPRALRKRSAVSIPFVVVSVPNPRAHDLSVFCPMYRPAEAFRYPRRVLSVPRVATRSASLRRLA